MLKNDKAKKKSKAGKGDKKCVGGVQMRRCAMVLRRRRWCKELKEVRTT